MVKNSDKLEHFCKIYTLHCQQHTDDDEAHFILGIIQFLLNNIDDAIRTFKICMKINPTFKSLNFNLGLCYIALNQFVEAEKFFRSELENTNYSHLNSALNLANIYLKKMNLFSIHGMIELEDIIQKAMIQFSQNEVLKRDFVLIKYVNKRNKKWSKYRIFNTRKEIVSLIPKDGIAAEIGVQEGLFSEVILKQQPFQLHLVDCWDYQGPEVYKDHHANISQAYHDNLYQKVLEKFNNDIQNKRVIIHKDYSTNALQSFENEIFDWIYIDANHDYEFVKKDLNLAYEKTKTGGFICGHDYVSEECVRGYGVEQAVDEFIEEKNMIPVGITNEFYASFILQKPEVGL